MSINEWREPERVRQLLVAVQKAEKGQKLIGTTELRRLVGMSDRELLVLVDELMSSGYLLGDPHRGTDEHFFEYTNVRLGQRAINELSPG